LARRSGNAHFKVTDYAPCPKCEEWIILEKSITYHQKSCPASQSSNEVFHKGATILTVSVLAGKINLKGSKILQKEVIPCMKRDDVGKIAIHDDLIVGLGDIWVMKNVDNKRKRRNYSSFHMRLAARLLKELRKTKNQAQLSFTEAIKPSEFDMFVESSLTCGYADPSKQENDDMCHPSVPLKLGFDISRLAGLKLAQSIKKSDEFLVPVMAGNAIECRLFNYIFR